MRTLSVELGARSYPVVLGQLADLGARAAQHLRPGPCALVSDSHVAPLHGEAALRSLEAAGFSPKLLVLPAGEDHKNLSTWQVLLTELLILGAERSLPVFALGGGVVGDIAGFAAATALRGLPLVQVPTTLLAMVDSSVGGKTGVNTPQGKNLVGAFHQPVLVLAAMDTLRTLPDEELRCGLGEVIKHAVLEGEDHFALLERRAADILARDPAVLVELVARSVACKAAVVAADERESGQRALLNAGHTLGHALELALGYGALRHGEAVAIGLLAEADIARRRGLASLDFLRRLQALTQALGLPTRAPGLDPERVLAATAMDKKRTCGKIVCALPVGIGRVKLEQVSDQELAEGARTAIEGLEDR